MSGGNVTITNTAHASIASKASAVIAITKIEYTVEEYNKFERSLVTIARSVKSEHNGGKHGYAGLLLKEELYRKLLKDTTATFTAHTKPSRTATYAAAATAAEIALAKETHAADREQYYKQEGVNDALKFLILTNAPAEALMELEDDDTGFDNVTPLELMDHLRDNARVTDVFDKKQLLNELDAPIDFDGDIPLKGHLKNVEATIKLLKKHGIDASPTILMVNLLEQIKAHGDLKEEVGKWELKPVASQKWDDFKTHFSAADHERRQLDQYGAKTARTVGATINNVNGITTIPALKSYVDDSLLAFAQATTAGLNAVMEKPPAAAATTTPSAVDDRVAALEAELKKLKAGNKGTGKNGSNGQTTATRAKCKHCNRHHPNVPSDKCWALLANQASKPDGWSVKGEKTKQD